MTYAISDDQVTLRSRTSGNTQLSDFMDKRVIEPGAWSESQVVTVGAAQYALVDSSELSGNISIGTGTATDGYICAQLGGAVGTAATTQVTNNGDILNLCPIRDASTHEEVKSSNGFTVYGLFQCASTATDGDAIAADASENVQLSFVDINASGTVALVTMTAGDYEFVVPSCMRMRNMTDFRTFGNPLPRQVLGTSTITARTMTVTTAFVSDEVMTISTGAGATAGVSSIDTNEASTITIGASAAAFRADDGLQVYLNGVRLLKAVDIIWDSSDSFHTGKALHVGDMLSIVKTT